MWLHHDDQVFIYITLYYINENNFQVKGHNSFWQKKFKFFLFFVILGLKTAQTNKKSALNTFFQSTCNLYLQKSKLSIKHLKSELNTHKQKDQLIFD